MEQLLHDSWITMPDPAGSDSMFVGYCYVDRMAGLSAKGVVMAWPGSAAEAATAATRPQITIRLSAALSPRAMSDPDIARLQLPARPAWADLYGPPPDDRPWRNDPTLAPYRHAELPDDIEARFYFWEVQRVESMWVSIRAVDPAVEGYAGQLLNEAHSPGAPLKGSSVSVRVAPGCPQPIWVSPDMRANRARWKSLCTVCEFDMLMKPAAEIAAKQFPDAPAGCVPVKFTTRCPLCSETMMVDSRV